MSSLVDNGEVNRPATVRVMAAIPSYNEETNIAAVVAGTLKYVSNVVVIDDGSIDRTAQIAEAAGADVIRHQQNRGKAGAIMTAFHAALSRNVEFLVLLDGDGQHDPDDIPRLLDPVVSGVADVVVGSRFLDIRNPIPFYRTIGQRVLNVATHVGSGLRCSDSQCGFRVFNVAAFSRIRVFETFLHGLAVESEMQFEMARHGLRLVEIPIYVSYDERARRSPVKHGFGVLYRVLAMTGRKWTGEHPARGTMVTPEPTIEKPRSASE